MAPRTYAALAAALLLVACGRRAALPASPSAPEHLLPAGALLAASVESAPALAAAVAGSPQGRLLAEQLAPLLASSRGALAESAFVRAAINAGGPAAIALYARGPEAGEAFSTVLAARTGGDPRALLQELSAAARSPGEPGAAGSRELQGEKVVVLADPAAGEILAASERGALLLERLTLGRPWLPDMIQLARGAGSSLASSLVFAEAFAELPRAGSGRGHCFVDLRRAVELADEALQRETSGPGGRFASALWAGLDPRSLQSFAVAVDFAPEGLRASWQLAMTDRVGLTALLRLPDRPLVLPRILPEPGAGAGGLIVTRLNFQGLLESLERAMSGNTGMGDSFWNNVLQAPDRLLGLRVREEVLGRLTDELALVILPGALDEPRSLPALLGRIVLVAGITDVQGLKTSIDRTFHEHGLHAGRKVRKVGGGEVWQTELAGARVGIAFGRRCAGLAVGDGIGYLEQVLVLEAGSGDTRPAPLASHAGEGNPIALVSVDIAAVLDLLQQGSRIMGGNLSVAPLAARLRELRIARVFERAEQTPSGIRGTLTW